MTTKSKASEDKSKYVEKYMPVKTILISQQKPEDKSPYYDLEEKWGLTIDWVPFIQVEPVLEKDFRKNRINLADFPCVIFASRGAIDNFFRLANETRAKISPNTLYFCLTEAIANYLQKFILYRKRKVFVGIRAVEDLLPNFTRHKDKKYLLPTSNLGSTDITSYLKSIDIDFTQVVVQNTVSADLSDLSDVYYDVLIFFSPQGIESLIENFPGFKQNNTRIAVFGNVTEKAVEDHGLYANIKADNNTLGPSMTMALENYLMKANAPK